MRVLINKAEKLHFPEPGISLPRPLQQMPLDFEAAIEPRHASLSLSSRSYITRFNFGPISFLPGTPCSDSPFIGYFDHHHRISILDAAPD